MVTIMGAVITTSNNTGPCPYTPWVTGVFPPIVQKKKCYILTSNKNGFDSFLALGTTDEERKEYKFIFVEKADDFNQGDGKLKIMNDFALNPNMDEILKFLEEKLTFRDGNLTQGSWVTGSYQPTGTIYP